MVPSVEILGRGMFCTECGKDNLDRAEFCAVCGTRMRPGAEVTHPTEAQNGPSTSGVAHDVPAESEVGDITEAAAGSADEDSEASPVSDDEHDTSFDEPERESLSLRRVVGWVLVAAGFGVFVLAALGLFNALGGIDGVVSRPSANASEEASSESADNGASRYFAPNLIGLTETDAVSRLESLGVSRDEIIITKESLPATAEVVVDQTPRSGEIVTDTIELVVAIPVFVMPDTVGLDREIALAMIDDAGLDSSSVSIEERPYGAPKGLVLSQSPQAGTVDPADARLVVAAIAPAPDVAGQTTDAALKMLETIGAEVTFASVNLLDVPPNTVVAQSIAPGDPVTGPIELTIAVEPPSTSLVDLGATGSSSCFIDDVEVGDVRYPNELYCRARQNSNASVSYDLAGRFVRLRLTAHVTDSSSASSGTVELIGNGTVLQRLSVSTGKGEVVDLDVRSVSTLEIRVSGDNVRVVMLNARVYEPVESSP